MAVVHNIQNQIQDDFLGEHLVGSGKLNQADLLQAYRVQQDTSEHIAAILVRLGLVSERNVAEAVAAHHSSTLVELQDYPDTPLLFEHLSIPFLKQHRILPIDCTDDCLTMVSGNTVDSAVTDAIRFASGRRVEFRIGISSEIDAALERLYGSGKSRMARIVDNLVDGNEDQVSEAQIEQLRDMASEGPVIQLVNLLIEQAVTQRASDIHIEPFEQSLRVRYRVDGILQEAEAPPAHLSSAVISRIKIMARLDIAERRLPQDGRIHQRIRGCRLDLRISTLPTMHGESVVMRLLYKDSADHSFQSLGFENETLFRFKNIISRPHGIVIVTGPTGSGKTTTLYAGLTSLNDPERKIITVEDPVEYELPGINQIQVKPQIGLSFANTLRSIVRQDPDIIMIGEMRDLETAEIATQSALTGHLVLSTLHTNNAAGSITRLLDMGLEPYLVTSVLNGVVAQRLVRCLCPQCKRACEALPSLLEETGLSQVSGENLESAVLFEPVGCEECRWTGYAGRTAIVELLEVTEQIRDLVLHRADASQIAQTAIENGMKTMYEDGLIKVLEGVTSLEEILRVTREV